ncbi:uncharacterized protein LAJ45_02170 [Morchella importuna]|uniref:uncharacterized protein n=1 Tax=Morchella importuna TaxID=1174673 RepID=UPI001E8D4CF6|nr:uncharacterized protein LAJ45_02170 [Morchella importuna]KAH8153358.1 hypothetical protein LAJ45_02170 [Morchella importuna]
MNTTTTVMTMIQDDGGDDSNRCELLGPFALFVQAALGGMALLSLVWKRSRESPQRPLKIWWFDVSKQVFGSVLVHMANIVLSMLSSGTFGIEPTPAGMLPPPPGFPPPRGFGPPPPGFGGPPRSRRDFGGPPEDDPTYHPNPCSFYLLNLGIDTTIGIAILIVILRVLHTLLAWSPFEFFKRGINSGDYGDPPRWSWWLKQAIIYFMGLMGMKFVVWIIFALCPWLGHVGDWLLAWTEGNKRLQVFFVMFFFPLVMNGVQYYIIDSYIKKKSDKLGCDEDIAPIPGSLSNHRRSFDSAGDIFNSDDEEANADSRSLLRPSSRRSRGTDKKMA